MISKLNRWNDETGKIDVKIGKIAFSITLSEAIQLFRDLPEYIADAKTSSAIYLKTKIEEYQKQLAEIVPPKKPEPTIMDQALDLQQKLAELQSKSVEMKETMDKLSTTEKKPKRVRNRSQLKSDRERMAELRKFQYHAT